MGQEMNMDTRSPSDGRKIHELQFCQFCNIYKHAKRECGSLPVVIIAAVVAHKNQITNFFQNGNIFPHKESCSSPWIKH